MLEVHVDDWHATGPKGVLEEMGKEMENFAKVKEWRLHSPTDGVQYDHLQRMRTRVPEGTRVHANVKYIDGVAALLGMQRCISVPAPAVKGQRAIEGEEMIALDDGEAQKYRSAVGTLLYVAPDKMEVQWPIGELASDMKSPRKSSMRKLKRAVRYLAGEARDNWHADFLSR